MSYWEECMYDWHGGPDAIEEPLPHLILPATEEHQTEKAILFKNDIGKFWVAKKAVVAIEEKQVILEGWCKVKYL